MSLTPEDLIEKCPDLASLPDVYHKLNEAINSPSCTTGIISRIVSHDPSLTLKILKIVNSAFYGFPHEIEDIPQAIVIIGLQQLNDLVLAHSIINLFENKKTAPFSLEEFWKFSIASGLEAKILSSYSKQKSNDRIFVGGLLHNIGKLLMATAEPDLYEVCCQVSRDHNLSCFDAETKVFGFSHMDVNRVLMKSWNIPQSISEISSNYLTPEVSNELETESNFILVAHGICSALGLGTTGEIFLPEISDANVRAIQLNTAQLEESLIPLHEQFSEVTNTFLG
ncbi:MAG: HDOD domain-containing protein [Lentisphaeraceae bacterium]|nr:HDOD domain-containing protein [Lentisphaeraceae bacterium]